MSIQSITKAKKPSLLGRFLGLSLWQKGLIVILIVGVIWFAGTKFFGQKSSTSQYQTATAQQGNIISTVSESGNVSADSQTTVTSPATGIVQKVYVKNGDTVSAGQKLFTVKSTATPQEKASAYASYLSAQNTLNSAQATLNSLQSTMFKANQTFINDKGVPNPTDLQKSDPVYVEERADWLKAEADYKNQSGVISQAQAALQSASLSYQATQNATVTAPVGGTVANLSVSPGSSVIASSNNASSNSSSSNSSSSSSGSSGSTVLVIGNFSKLSVVAQVNEVDLPKIKVGQNAIVTLDAFPNETFVGKVVNVDSIGTVSSGVVTYNVYIDLVSPPAEIKSGMTASVNIQTARADNVITVPSAAVQTSNGASYVRVLKNGKVTETPVTVGISDDTNTEIKSGISSGDVVVTGTATTTSGSSTASPFSSGGRGGGGAFFRRGG